MYFLQFVLVFILVFSASSFSGAILGFLFGLPRNLEMAGRTVEQRIERPSPEDTESDVSSKTRSETFATSGWSNNNLIEVSDWLTKIIVGLGLIQFNNLVAWIGSVGRPIGKSLALTGDELQLSVGVSLVVSGFIVGFLASYYVTRTHLAVMLARHSSYVTNILNALREKDEEVAHLQVNVEHANKAYSSLARHSSVSDNLAEAIRALYMPMPQSFTKAKPFIDSLIAEDRDDPYHWTLRACALGQEYQFKKATNQPNTELRSIANSAISAIKEVVALEKVKPTGEVKFLRSLWSRDDPGFSEKEGDLVAFWDDDNLRKEVSEALNPQVNAISSISNT